MKNDSDSQTFDKHSATLGGTSTTYYDLSLMGQGGCYFQGGYVYCSRLTSGTFDSTYFDSTPFNRGYVEVTYID